MPRKRSSLDAPSPTLSKVECLGKGRGCFSWTGSHILRGNLTKGKVLGIEIVLRGIRGGRKVNIQTFSRAEFGERLADVGSSHKKLFALKQRDPICPRYPCRALPPKSSLSHMVSAFLQNISLPFPGLKCLLSSL